MSVKTLQSIGLWPNILVCRSDYPLDEGLRKKIALFCNVPKEYVLQNLDANSLYEVPLMMEQEHLAEVVCESLQLPCPEPDLTAWKKVLDNLHNTKNKVTIALIGKYIELHDAYLSVAEALRHAGIAQLTDVKIDWIDSETITAENAAQKLAEADGILVPGGFGLRGIEGKIQAINYARTHKVPFLGICLGMQLAIVEFARNVLGLADASSIEFHPETTNPVIHLMPEQEGIENLGGTLRLGSYPCQLMEGSQALALYGTEHITERHRHRYEVNNDYRQALEAAGMRLSGLSPNGRIVEMIELAEHPYFLATQAHPEFKSRPDVPHPLFSGLIAAALKHQGKA